MYQSEHPVGTHTHLHSGDRLWTNKHCPICRSQAVRILPPEELGAAKEKERDRLLLHLSLDLDKDFICRAKVQCS